MRKKANSADTRHTPKVGLGLDQRRGPTLNQPWFNVSRVCWEAND